MTFAAILVKCPSALFDITFSSSGRSEIFIVPRPKEIISPARGDIFWFLSK